MDRQLPQAHDIRILPRYYEVSKPYGNLAVGDEISIEVPGQGIWAYVKNLVCVHTGIYVGNGRVISKYYNRNQGHAYIRQESIPKEHMLPHPDHPLRWQNYKISRKGHWYSAQRALAAYEDSVLNRANSVHANYDVFLNNCKNFTEACLKLSDREVHQIYQELEANGAEIKTMSENIVVPRYIGNPVQILPANFQIPPLHEDASDYFLSGAAEHLADLHNSTELQRVIGLQLSQSIADPTKKSELMKSWGISACWDNSNGVLQNISTSQQNGQFLQSGQLEVSIPVEGSLPQAFAGGKLTRPAELLSSCWDWSIAEEGKPATPHLLPEFEAFGFAFRKGKVTAFISFED